MTLWLILTIMTSAAAIWLSVPLIRRFDRLQAESARDIEVYRDQLREVEGELRQGLIDNTQAEMATVEIKRRILAADRPQRAVMPKLTGGERNVAIVCVTGIVVLGSVVLYAVTGSPDLASRQEGAEGFGIAERTQRSDTEGEAPPQANLPSVEEMIQRLTARLSQNPKDTEGWRTLGWSYLNIGRFHEAAEAYARAIALNPDIVELRADRIEALVESANGVVTSEAKAAIEDILKRDPKNTQARFFRGLAEEQQGDKASALAEWSELLKDTNSDESWATELQNRISELRRDIRINDGSLAEEQKPAITEGLRGIARARDGSQTPQS